MWGLIRIMIIGSLLLLVAGAGFLITGLAIGNDSFLIGTIAASLLAAVCLYAGSRNRAADDVDVPRNRRELTSSVNRADGRSRTAGRRRREGDDYDRSDELDRIPKTRTHGSDDYIDIDVDTSLVPADEPGEISMSSVEAAALMRMDAEVMVVDGRPRFHLGGCVHLIGRDSEPLPAYEAVELGFSACALCRPAQALLREPTHR